MRIDFVVIDTGKVMWLGLVACEKLCLIQIDDAMEATVTSTLIDEYADVFSGIGVMYSIGVDLSVHPMDHLL